MQGYLARLSQLTESFSKESRALTIKALLVEIKKAGESSLEHTSSDTDLGAISEKNYLATLAQLVVPLETLAKTDIFLDPAQKTTLTPDHLTAMDTIESLASMTPVTAGDLVDFITSNPGLNIAIPGINLPFPDNFKILAKLALTKITNNIQQLQECLLELIEAGSFAFFESTITALIDAKKLPRWAAAINQQLITRVLEGDLNKVNCLCAAGANVLGAWTQMTWESKLISGAILGEVNIVKCLRAVGVNLSDPARETMGQRLIEKAWINELNKVKAMLAAGAKPDLKDHRGMTALMIACYQNNIEMAQALVAAGADPYQQNNDGQSALYIGQDNPRLMEILTANTMVVVPQAATATAFADATATGGSASSASPVTPTFK